MAVRRRVGNAPHPPLERTDRLLPRLVEELLLGILRLPLLDGVLAQPRVHLGLQIGRELRVLVDHVLEVGREVNLAGADARERVEGLRRQRRRAVLDGAGQTVLVARDAGQLLERVQVDLDVGPHAAVGVDEAAVSGTGLDADLAEADQVAAALLQRTVEAVHVRVQLVDVGVLAAHLANLAADRHGDALWLVLPDERREVGGEGYVDFLLLGQRRLRQIDERRGVDVDVVEAGRDFFLDQRAQGLELLVAFGAVVLLRVGLDVIALDEDRTTEPLAQRRPDHDRRVLVGTLFGVADLGARDLENERPGIEGLRRTDDGAGGVVRHRANVDRRNREPSRFPRPIAM